MFQIEYLCLHNENYRSAVQRVVDDSYTIAKLHIEYPLQWIDPEETPNLQQSYGCVLDILQVIAEFLLTIDYEDIIT